MKKIQITITSQQITKALIFLAYAVIGFFLILPLMSLTMGIPISLPDFLYGTLFFVILQDLFLALEIAVIIFFLNLAVKAVLKIKTGWLFVILPPLISVFVFWSLIYLKDAYEYRAYSNKHKLCVNFAHSYLASMRKIENIEDSGSEKWKMVVDIETDLYELCLLDLDEQSLGSWESVILKKYQRN